MSGSIVFVTGEPGAGKTAIGRAMAKKLSCPLIDIDDDIRKLFGPVDTSVNTHSGKINNKIGDLGHQFLFDTAEFWAAYRPEQPVIFTIPMIRPNRQKILQEFCTRFPGQVKVIVVTLDNDTDEEVLRRIARRKADGYVGGVDTLEEYRRVKGTAEPMPLQHTVIDTSPPHTIEQCIDMACEIVR